MYNQKNVFDFLTLIGDRLQDIRDLMRLLGLPCEAISSDQISFLQLSPPSQETTVIESKFSLIMSDYPQSQMPFVILGQLLGLVLEEAEPPAPIPGAHRLSGPKTQTPFSSHQVWNVFFRSYFNLQDMLCPQHSKSLPPIVFGHPLFRYLIV